MTLVAIDTLLCKLSGTSDIGSYYATKLDLLQGDHMEEYI